MINEFALDSDLNIHIKQFSDSDSLFEELSIVDVKPDIIEVDSLHFPKNIKDNFHTNVSFLNDTNVDTYHEAAVESFILNNHVTTMPLGMEIPIMVYNESFIDEVEQYFPFANEQKLKKYASLQSEWKTSINKSPFWMFHFDDELEWHEAMYHINRKGLKDVSFQEKIHELTETYQLMPSLENYMAISRFGNNEIGILMTNSTNIHTIQELVGNRFNFEIKPFIESEADSILIKSNGLFILNNKTGVEDVLEYLSSEGAQEKLLASTGWLPADKELLHHVPFIRKLPVYKYIEPLIKYEQQFISNQTSN